MAAFIQRLPEEVRKQSSSRIDSFCKGFHNELRFESVANGVSQDRPRWFLGVELVGPYFDDRGVDAVAAIMNAQGKNVLVPLQIKSSLTGIKKHLDRYPDDWIDRVPIIVVNDRRTDDRVRNELYRQLKHIQRGRYDFSEFFKQFDWRFARPPQSYLDTRRAALA